MTRNQLILDIKSLLRTILNCSLSPSILRRCNEMLGNLNNPSRIPGYAGSQLEHDMEKIFKHAERYGTPVKDWDKFNQTIFAKAPRPFKWE